MGNGTELSTAQRLPGDSAIVLSVSGLAARSDTLFLYSGPRATVEGSTVHALAYSPPSLTTGAGTYRPLARVRANRAGAVTATLHLPADTAYGTATILAFQAHCLRCQPEAMWRVDVTARDPDLVLVGAPNQQVVVAQGVVPSGAVDSSTGCGLTLDSSGTAALKRVVPGVSTVITQSPRGSLFSQNVVLLPNSTVHVNVSGRNFQTVCSSVHVNSVLSSMSGQDNSPSGNGPFGYFLSGVPMTDNLLITASDNGRALPGDLVRQSYVDLIDPNGNVVHHYPLTGATSTTVSAWANIQIDPIQVQTLVGPGTAAGRLIAGVIDELEKVPSTFTLNYNPGELPPGNNRLRVGFGDCVQDYRVTMIDPHWNSPVFALSSPPTFNRSTKTYSSAGTVPPDAIDINKPFDPGWDRYGPLPEYHYHIDNILKAGIFIDENFTTAGHWTASQARATLFAELLNYTLLDDTKDLAVNNLDPQRPGYGLERVDFPLFDYDPGEPIVSIPIYGFHIAHVGGIGFTFDIFLHVHTGIYFAGYVNPDLSLNEIALGAEGSLAIDAGVGLTLVAAGVDAGLGMKATLDFPLDFKPSGISTPVCLSGDVHFFVKWWYDLWVASDSGYLYNATIATFHFPGGCSGIEYQQGLRAHLLREMLSPKPIAEPAAVMAAPKTSAAPRRAHPASPVVRFDHQGHGMSAWVRSEPTQKKDILVAAPWNGGTWGAPAPVASSNAAIVSPQLTELGDGRAILVWVQNTVGPADVKAMAASNAAGDPSGALDRMIDRQEIFSSVYGGGRWSAPRQMTHDDIFDNDPVLAADEAHHTAVLVWTRGNDKSTTELVTSTFNGTSWSNIASVPGTRGTEPHNAAIVASGQTYTVAWAHDAIATSTLALASHSAGRWTALHAPALPSGVQEIALAQAGKRLVLATSILPAAGANVRVQESTIWSATLKGNAWTVQKVAPYGDSPNLDGGRGGAATLTFRQPITAGAGAAGLGEIGLSMLLPGGRFSRVAVVARGASDFTHPSTARTSGSTLQLLYGVVAPDPNFPSVGAAPRPISPAGVRTLDSKAGIQAAVLRLTGRPVLDLKHARLSVAHPAPGQAVKLSVPVINNGAGKATVNAVLVVHSGRKVLARANVHLLLAPYGVTAVPVSFRAGSDGITLTTTGVPVARGKELGLPLPATRLVASPNSDGSVGLRWVPAKDHDITGYRIYRSAGKSFELIGLSSDPEYVDTDPGLDPKARYAVTAVDKQGRESFLSKPAALFNPPAAVRQGSVTGGRP